VVDLPEGVVALVSDLTERGFAVVEEEWQPKRASGWLVLRRDSAGVSAVRIEQDLGVWGVEVEIARELYDPGIALRAVQDLPHEQRAASHAERRIATLAVVDLVTGDADQVRSIRARHDELSEALTRWASGSS
jgi:hypothetical protein